MDSACAHYSHLSFLTECGTSAMFYTISCSNLTNKYMFYFTDSCVKLDIIINMKIKMRNCAKYLHIRNIVIVWYIFNFQFSDEEEETKRVVRSAKEKRYEDLTNIMKQIRNFKKIKDMSSMLSSKCTLLPFIYINGFTL